MRDGAPQEGLPEENPDSMGTWPDRGNSHPWCADSRERAACPEGTGRYRALPAEQTEAPQGQEEGQGSLQPLRPLRQRAGVPSVTPVRGCTARSHPWAGTKTGATGVPRCEEATASDAGGTARQECAGARSQDRTGSHDPSEDRLRALASPAAEVGPLSPARLRHSRRRRRVKGQEHAAVGTPVPVGPPALCARNGLQMGNLSHARSKT